LGAGNFRLEKIQIFSGNRPTSSLSAGSPFSIHFSLSKLTKDMSCIFTIYNQYSQPVATFESTNQGTQDQVNPELGTLFICELEKLLLYPGRYRINVAIYADKELQDHIENAVMFEVEPGLVGGRVIQPNRYVNAYLDHIWKQPPL
jgi:lipopolysaccharide transport system ATP-binding protein